MPHSTRKARIHTWDTNSSRSAKAKATTHKLALMRAMCKLPITVGIQRWMAHIRRVSSSMHTFFRKTVSHKVFTALSTTKRGRPLTQQTTDKPVAPIVTQSLDLTATPWRTLQIHQPPYRRAALQALLLKTPASRKATTTRQLAGPPRPMVLHLLLQAPAALMVAAPPSPFNFIRGRLTKGQ